MERLTMSSGRVVDAGKQQGSKLRGRRTGFRDSCWCASPVEEPAHLISSLLKTGGTGAEIGASGQIWQRGSAALNAAFRILPLEKNL
jgi:hypothetical protein